MTDLDEFGGIGSEEDELLLADFLIDLDDAIASYIDDVLDGDY